MNPMSVQHLVFGRTMLIISKLLQLSYSNWKLPTINVGTSEIWVSVILNMVGFLIALCRYMIEQSLILVRDSLKNVISLFLSK